VWGEPGPGGVRRRRIVIVAAPDGIRPEWPMGFHAATMEAWRQWAERWAAVALHHGGIAGAWAVDAHGVVRPAEPKPAAMPKAPARPPEAPRAPGPQTRWGAAGLPWGRVAGAAPDPLPPLAAPLPPERVQDVIAALAMLGIPDVRGEGGVRGLAVDTTWIRPHPTQAQRVLRMGEALAGQLGHGSQPLRIAYVQGKPGVLAVERPRPDRQFVELLAAAAQTPARVRQALAQWALPICCGVAPDGTVVWQDAAGWPHLLAGGTTGGGKTTALAAWLGSLCLTTPPEDVEIAIVDPKAGSQFPWAAGMPHVRRVLTDPAEVAALVAEWAAEADRRYAAFARLGVADLRAARGKGAVGWAYRLLVVDEYKDLKDQLDADAVKDLERDIGRLGQKARGAGIHVWLATQHPLAETLSSPLKANLPARLALTVASATASRVILDDVGAEALTGKGDALFWHAEAQRTPIRIQTPWVADATWAAIQAGWGAAKEAEA
jgi:S-DNA-T family DNA segregation ATPase FtsK/SpoIIIE